MDEKIYDIVFTESVSEFIDDMPESARRRLFFIVRKVEAGMITDEIFKKLVGTNLWEFRVIAEKKHYRLFSFFDPQQKKIIVACHAIMKKTQKTPKSAIATAEKIREEYIKTK